MMESKITGIIKKLSTGQAFLETEAEKLLPIDIEGIADIPLETPLNVVLKDNKLISFTQPLLARAAQSENVLVVLRKVIKRPPTEEDFNSVREAAKTIQDEYRRNIQGRFDFVCLPAVQEVDPTVNISLFGNVWANLDPVTVPEEFSNYVYKSHIWGGTGPVGVAGQAFIGGGAGITFESAAVPTMIHEIGHQLGLDHAGSETAVYGEDTAWMGSGTHRRYHNAPHLSHIGLVEEYHIVRQPFSERFHATLVEPDTQLLAIKPDEKKMIELSFGFGTPSRRLSISYEDGSVWLHRPYVSAASTWPQTAFIMKLRKVGDSWINDRYGIKVKWHKTIDSAAVVEVVGIQEEFSPNIDAPEWPQLIGEPLVDKGGVWGNRDWNVQGIHVHMLDPSRREMLVEWLTWDTYGNQIWSHMVGTIDNNNVVSGPLTSVEVDGPIRRAISVGDAELYFTEDGGVFRANHKSLGRFATKLELVAPFKPHPMAGRWGIPSRGKEGLAVGLAENNTMVAYHLHYEGRYNLRWDLIQGPVGGDLTIYKITGGKPGIPTKSTTGTLQLGYNLTPVGSCRIENQKFIIDGVEHNLNKLA